MTDTRTIVTVHPMSDERPVRYDNALWRSDVDGDLQLLRDGATFAIWARGTWQRAELTEEPAEPPHAVADRIARGYYKATGSDLTFEQDREAHGSTSVAVLLTAAALDGINARENAPAEPEQPSGSGTFEVYEFDDRGKYRWRLKAHNGEVIASGQAYTTRKGARAGAAAVQRAAKGAPIEDVDSDR